MKLLNKLKYKIVRLYYNVAASFWLKVMLYAARLLDWLEIKDND